MALGQAVVQAARRAWATATTKHRSKSSSSGVDARCSSSRSRPVIGRRQGMPVTLICRSNHPPGRPSGRQHPQGRRREGSAEGVEAGEGLADREGVDLLGALVGEHRLRGCWRAGSPGTPARCRWRRARSGRCGRRRSPARTLLSLPTLTCSGVSVPASLRSARWCASSDPVPIRTAISASFCWVSWNPAMGRPNCCRGRRRSPGPTRSTPRAAPIAPQTMPYRASLRQDSGPLSPRTPGRTASAGSRTASMTSSPVIEARSDILCLISGAENPAVSVGTTKPRTPAGSSRWPRPAPRRPRRRRPARW